MKEAAIFVIVVILTFTSSLELIKTRHTIRHALNALDQLLEETEELKIENNKLLLEYTHLTSGYRIEGVAKARLDMHNPEAKDIIDLK